LGHRQQCGEEPQRFVSSDPFTIEEDIRSFMTQNDAPAPAAYGLTDAMDVRFQASWQDGQTATRPAATALPPPRPSPNANVGDCPSRHALLTWIYELNRCRPTAALHPGWRAFYLDERVPVTLLRDNRHTTDFVASNSTIITEADIESLSVF
jgi:iron complex outermembrane receptor protein